ncbi:SDR family oxidoreductase [Agrobacterium sp. V1]|uniref:SDR family oxidoreductase n=1 Tax=Agrobacterium sp. V1 TaxID=3061957 RepID=UPI00267389FC|nr:SDR family oxidoreductase [Agrobacterium sp. V1]MDO3445493.1 SDR family oxidoreductase [Agrobacterium sp. V1]
MKRFDGKRVLVTGGTNGMGLAGAERLFAEGAAVTITGRSAEGIARVSSELPSDIRVIQNDAAAPDAGSNLVAQLDNGEMLDGLWLNAGIVGIRPFDDVNAAFFDQLMNTNVRGPALQLAALAERLNDGASIVLTSSTSAYERTAITSIYSATKGALVSMARCWATALSPRSIRVNVLVPGAVKTNLRSFLSAEQELEFEERLTSLAPLSRIAEPGEAAAVALFLLSDDASYVTGSQYAVDGGLVMF